MSVTMVDVAAAAGVSLKSVSNYFNDYPYMSEDLRSRIERAVQELGYQVNSSARSLRSGRTRTIALVVPELNQPYFAQLAEDVIASARELGMHVAIETTRADPEREREVLTGRVGPAADGIIFETVTLGQSEIPFDAVQRPLVLIGERISSPQSDAVTMDNLSGAAEAVSHLIAQGRRRILALGHNPSALNPSAAHLREQGYRRAHEDAGLEVDPELIVQETRWRWPSGAAAMEEVLRRGVEFDAVFGFNDALALGAMTSLGRAGISIPEDVSVVGFDNVEEGELLAPTLTTVDAGRRQIARHAVEMLAERIGDPGESREPRSVVVPSRLVHRESA